jgi:hypothetical protein
LTVLACPKRYYGLRLLADAHDPPTRRRRYRP